MASKIARFAAVLLASFAACAHASMLRSTAQRTSEAPDPGYQALVNAANAGVGVKVKALPNARSNDTLGEEREGSGIVIRDDGLVLTIGYLIMEADQIEVKDSTGVNVPATLVAYDHATGFGLIKPLAKLTPKPIRLGTSVPVSQL